MSSEKKQNDAGLADWVMPEPVFRSSEGHPAGPRQFADSQADIPTEPGISLIDPQEDIPTEPGFSQSDPDTPADAGATDPADPETLQEPALEIEDRVTPADIAEASEKDADQGQSVKALSKTNTNRSPTPVSTYIWIAIIAGVILLLVYFTFYYKPAL